AIYHGPHLPEAGCTCRNPLPGLVEQAARDLGLDPPASFLVGDHLGDMQLARAVGATSVLVLTGHGEAERPRAEPLADHVARDLAEAAAIIRGLHTGESTCARGKTSGRTCKRARPSRR